MADQYEAFLDGGAAPAADKYEEFLGPEKSPPKSGAIRRGIGDTAVSLARGIVGVPEALTGIADLATGGRAGKALQDIGVRYKDAKDIIGDYYSPEAKAAQAEVNKADGFFPTIGAMIQNPSTIVNSALESAPSMLAGGVVSRGALALAPKMSPIIAGAFGEGATAAGQNAEQVRQEDPNGTLTGRQSAILAASGALTAGISGVAGKVANKLGIGDVQTMLATGKLGAVGKEGAEAAAKKGTLRKIGEGFAVEGGLQELPQSYQEQVAQNIAQGKPWDQGAAAAGAQGLMAGGLMGAVAGPMGGHGEQQPAAESPPVAAPVAEVPPQATPAAPLALPAPAAGDAIRAQKLPEAGPLTGAVNVGLENEAQAADVGAPPPVIVPPIPAAEATELTGKAGERAKNGADAQQFNAENQGSNGLSAGVLDTGVDAQELTLEQANALTAQPQDKSSRIPTGKAQDLQVDTAEPTADGLTPTVDTPSMTLRTAKQVPVNAMTDADVVAAYVAQRRAEGTLAGRRFAGDFDAGRITPADVLALVKPKIEATPDERLAAAAALAPNARTAGLVTADGKPIQPTQENASVDQPELGGSTRVAARPSDSGPSSSKSGDRVVGPLPTSTGGVQPATGAPVAGSATAGPDRVGAAPYGSLTARRLKALADSFRKQGTSTGKTFSTVLDGYSADLAAGKVTPEQVAPQIKAYTEILRKPQPTKEANGNQESPDVRQQDAGAQVNPGESQRGQADDAQGQGHADGAQAQDGVKPRTLKERRAAAAPVAPSGAFEHAGLKVYPGRVRVGDTVEDRWAVQLPKNKSTGKVLGDTLHKTREDAMKAAEQEAARYERKQRNDAELQAAEDTRKADDDARKAANRGKSLQESRADASLDKEVSKNGERMTRRQWVERKVAEGLKTRVEQEDRIKPMSRMQSFRASNEEQRAHDRKVKEAGKKDVFFIGDYEVTKTEHDYATRLVAERASATTPVAASKPPVQPEQVNAEAAKGLKARREEAAKRKVEPQRATIEPAKDIVVGKNDDGDTVYEVKSGYPGYPAGDRYVMRDGRPLFGGNLAVQDAEAAVATHKDPGEPAEPVTPAVVREAIKTGVQATDRKPSVMKAELLAEVDQAVHDAPDYTDFQGAVKAFGLKDATASYTSDGRTALGNESAPQGYSRRTRTFRVEGDGVFTVNNTVRQLLTFRAKVESSPGFRDKQAKPRLEDAAEGAQRGSGSVDAAIANMIHEGDMQAAKDFAKSKDVDLANVKLTKVLRDRLDKWTRDTEMASKVAAFDAPMAQPNVTAAANGAAKSLSGNEKTSPNGAQAQPNTANAGAVLANLQGEMGARKWAGETGGRGNTYWSKRVGEERYTAMYHEGRAGKPGMLEVLALADGGVDTGIAEISAATATEAARLADDAVAEDSGVAQAQPNSAKPEADPLATPESFNGKTITQQVQVADTGKTATLRMDAGQSLRDVNEREAALLKLKACVGR